MTIAVMRLRLRLRPLALALALPIALAGLAAPTPARAFCGFYVGGADQKLFNNATMVVLMRDGMRTVLSMQNNYQGPPQDFAMVVPVPIVLQKENVKTLPREVFQHIDALAAPRLVEYWEQDPCKALVAYDGPIPTAVPAPMVEAAPRGAGLGVKIEAQFTVGEYEVVILSAQDSSGLDTWLRLNKYTIPEGAEPILRPYVAAGMKFFVAKVDTKKVRFEGNQAMLSPLRFHYDSDTFNLPVRLGLLNSAGTQDLIVHILARGKRYEVANYPSAFIPTNYDVADDVRDRFGEFYAALFDKTIEAHPGAVVTEYSWDAQSCDPCPTPPLEPTDIATLGADALPTAEANPWGFTLTRLHARYGKDALGQDLVFKEAPGVIGGREEYGQKQQPHGAAHASVNNFQGRYIIRHAWTGAIKCDKPQRGIWGGPPDGMNVDSRPKAAQNTAFAPRGKVSLAALVREPVPELKLTPTGGPSPAGVAKSGGCGSCGVGGAEEGWMPAGIAAILALVGIGRRRRRG